MRYILSGDFIIPSNTLLTRYTSNTKETGSIRGTYCSYCKNDVNEYSINANENLRFDGQPNKIFIYTLQDATVADGARVLEYCVNRFGSKQDKEDLSFILNTDYAEASSMPNKCEIRITNNKIFEATQRMYDLCDNITLNNLNQLLDVFSKDYDAIVDPQDLVVGYECPLILINDDKFKRISL